MTRDELIDHTKRLVAEGDGLLASPSLEALRAWLQRSDDLLGAAWGTMDRYHLAWLLVGKPKEVIRGRPMTEAEEAAYVRDVASQKTAALRMSLDAVERQGMPFLGEEGGPARAKGRGATSGGSAASGTPDATPGGRVVEGSLPPGSDDLAARIRRAREEALAHEGHGQRRAPRPERMQR
jgi:hypothetical protein